MDSIPKNKAPEFRLSLSHERREDKIGDYGKPKNTHKIKITRAFDFSTVERHNEYAIIYSN